MCIYILGSLYSSRHLHGIFKVFVTGFPSTCSLLYPTLPSPTSLNPPCSSFPFPLHASCVLSCFLWVPLPWHLSFLPHGFRLPHSEWLSHLHAFTCIILFLFTYECYPTVYISHVFIFYLSAGGHLGHFQFLAIVNRAEISIDKQVSP